MPKPGIKKDINPTGQNTGVTKGALMTNERHQNIRDAPGRDAAR